MDIDDFGAAVLLFLLGAVTIAGCLLGFRYGATVIPRSCTFDGGGTLVSGDAGRTTDGHIWACSDGQLYKIK